jgi:hypothetical protein
MHLFRTATRLATAVVALDVSQSISYAIGVSADAMHDIGATLPVSQNAAARVEKGSTRPFCQPCPMGKGKIVCPVFSDGHRTYSCGLVCLCDPHAGLPTQAAATLLEARSPDQDLIVVTETHVITVVASAAKAPATASTSSVFPRKTKSESTNAAESTTSTSGDDVETYACSAPNGLIQCPFSGFNTPAAMLPQHTSIGKPQLDQRDEPVNDKNPTSVLASILSASSLWPEGVTPHMTPSVSNPLPSDCTDSLADQFAIQLVFNPAQSHPTKRAVSNLGIWLINGTLLDTLSRLGNIVANHQLQFDAFGQAGAVYTSGFSACGPPAARVLALGGNTTFWGCNSGGFANIYNENIAPQCVAAEIRLINNQNPGAPLLTSSDSEHVGASNESPVSSESVTFSYSPATISWANTSVLPTPSAPVTSTGDVDGSVSEYVLPSTSAQPPSTTYWTEFAKHEEIAADGIFQDVAAESTHSIHWIGDAIGSYPTAELKPMQTIHWMDKAVAQETSSASARSSHWISNAKRAPLDLADEAAEFNSYLLPTTIVRAFVEQTFTDVGDDGKDTVVTVPAMTKTFVLGPKDESEAAPTVALSQITALVSLLGRLGGSAPTSVAKAKRAMSLPPILPRTINHTASTNDTAAVVIVTELATAYETATFVSPLRQSPLADRLLTTHSLSKS